MLRKRTRRWLVDGATPGTWSALGLYLLVSFLFFGLPLAAHPGRETLGSGSDPDLFVWMFAWWPHALLHGLDPFRTTEIWVPGPYDLAWTTSVPALAVVFAPVTLLAGPVVAFNLASLLMPGLAAWTAYLLCRHVTGRDWPAIAGGYLFGFSAYMLGQEIGHLHMTAVFLVPLVPLLVLRYLEGTLRGRGLALRLGVLLGVQAWISTEVLLTLTLALVSSLAVVALVAPRRRRQVVTAVPALAAAYVLGVALASPLLVAMLDRIQSRPINEPWMFPADLVNLVVPTRAVLSGAGWAGGISSRFLGNDAENGAYLGLPTLIMVGLFVRRRWRTPAGRYLIAALAVSLLAALGTGLHVDGHDVVALPWELAVHVRLVENLLPVRLVLYTTLAAAVMVAAWAATTPHRRLAILLPALAVAALLPRLGAGYWNRTPVRPALFASGLYEKCLVRGESILALPYNAHGDSLLWQAESGFWFRLAEGYVSTIRPSWYGDDPAAVALWYDQIPAGGPQEMLGFLRSKGVTTIVVQQQGDDGWGAFFRQAIHPYAIGGTLVFPLQPGPESSPACASLAGRGSEAAEPPSGAA